MGSISKKNGKIELLRFVMAIIVLIHHTNVINPGNKIFERGSLAVEFFFLVSGYLMAAKCSKNENNGSIGKETWNFIKRKYCAVQPNVWIAEIIAFTVSLIVVPFCGFRNLALRIFGMLSEGFLLRQTGFNVYDINPVTWYISAMLIAMLVLYPICRKFYDVFSRIIAPILGTLLIGMLYLSNGTQTAPDKVIFGGFLYTGLIRAFAVLCLGVVCFEITKWLTSIEFTKIGKFTVSILEVLLYLVVFLIMNNPNNKFDTACLYVLLIAVALSFSQQGLFAQYFNCKLFNFLGSLSLSIYLCHQFWVKFVNTIFTDLPFSDKLIVYLVISLSCALVVHFLSQFLKSHCKKSLKIFVKSK